MVRKDWTKEEVNIAVWLHHQGCNKREISRRMLATFGYNRSADAVYAKLYNLNLVGKNRAITPYRDPEEKAVGDSFGVVVTAVIAIALLGIIIKIAI